VGHEDAYDLRVFDNAPVGVRHPGVSCGGCNEDRKSQSLPLRSQSRNVTARGIFKGAIVVRGNDWIQGYEKGEGTVLNICSTKNMDRGAAEVQFDSSKPQQSGQQ
ncbi:unnamed protein product, partial [Allacma fusca]